jgi:CheY-like chemotaxis protein
MHAHGGSIVAHSDGPGRGSRFTLHLPVADPLVAPTPPPPARASRPAAPGVRILVVDDNEDAGHTLGDLLRHAGHDVEVATSPEEALVAAARFAPQVAILDLAMPRMDGYDLAARLPEPRPVLVAVTGFGTERDRARSLAAGFVEHLAKPADPERLLAVIEEHRPTSG